jgi:outer membrane protein
MMVALLGASHCLYAAPSPSSTSGMPKREMRFAILDHDYVMEKADAARQAHQEIDARRAAFQADLEKEEQKLRIMEANLVESQQTLSEEEYAQKRQEWEAIVAETHKTVSDRRIQLENLHNHAREVIVEAILKIVAEVSRERGYDVVLPRSMVFYAEESYDITDEILARLNKELPLVSLDLPVSKGKPND